MVSWPACAPVATVGDDAAHQARVVEIGLGALAHRRPVLESTASMTGCLHSMQPMPALLQPGPPSCGCCRQNRSGWNCTGHFFGSPGSVRRACAGSVCMVRDFLGQTVGFFAQENRVAAGLDIFWPSRPGMQEALVRAVPGLDEDHLPLPSR